MNVFCTASCGQGRTSSLPRLVSQLQEQFRSHVSGQISQVAKDTHIYRKEGGHKEKKEVISNVVCRGIAETGAGACQG